MTVHVDNLDERLLNNYQRAFPLISEPFMRIADELGTDTTKVIARLNALQREGSVSRVGPVFRPNVIGASTLAAMAVAPESLTAMANIVNAFPEVNHNYEREHEYNLWFVVTAPSEVARDDALQRIEAACGHPVLSLPLERDYHIDLGFHMSAAACPNRTREVSGQFQPDASEPEDSDAALIRTIQGGLALVAKPFAAAAREAHQSESQVIGRIATWLDAGIIKRFGVIVRHHELGYRANAMAVWDVPDECVDELGSRFAELPWVTLCYRRRRQRPYWPYNLFCMIHGRERDAVLARIDDMTRQQRLHECSHTVLFSGRRFKQRGACYRTTDAQSSPRRAIHGQA